MASGCYKVYALLFLLVFSQLSVKEVQKIDPKILSSDSDVVNITVEIRDDAADIGFVNAIEKKKFMLGNFYSLKVPKSEITNLEKSSSVKRVWLEKEYKILLDVSAPLIGSGAAWNIGYNGSGIKVCVLDTGVNKTHPSLISRVINESDFTGEGTTDENGHGTHVAGIVGSTDSTYKGVAPAASILSAKVCNKAGKCKESWIMNGIDWCISQGVDILTLSISGAETPNDGSDALSQYMDMAVDKGKVVTIAAGNSGPSSGTTECPGCAHKVISIGSVYKQYYSSVSWSSCTDVAPQQNQISCFSSRGPTDDNRIKPDVTAPGAVITSASLSGGWTSKGGTSMAAPMVAGLSALIMQARNITPEEAKALLMNTAVDLGAAGKDNVYGSGRVNASRVFDEINNTFRGEIGSSPRVHNIFVPAGSSQIRAVLYWPENYSLHNDLDLYLLDPSGNERASSLSSYNTDESVALSNPSPSGYWKLLVDPYDVSGNQTYSIAANFLPSEQMSARVNNVSGRSAYHQINVTNGPLTVGIDWNFTDADLDIFLYNTTGHIVNYSSSDNNYEYVSAIAEAGMWLVRIDPVNLGGYQSVKYSLVSTLASSQQMLDTASPGITITEPTNRTYNSRNINLSFRAEDAINAAVNCSVSINNAAASLGLVRINSTRVYNFTASAGSNSISLACVDSSGNEGNSSAVYFSLDTTPPNITLLDSDSLAGRNYTFINASVTDLNEINSCILEWNGVNYTMGKTLTDVVTCFVNKTDSDGTYAYTIYASDAAGNTGNASGTVTLDTTLPAATVSFTGGANNTFSPNGDGLFDEITFNITASETVNFNRTYLLAENGNDVKYFERVLNTNSIKKTWNGCFIQNCNTGTVPDGLYKIEIKMTDMAGNVNTTNLTETIVLDTTPPVIYFASPTPNNTILSANNSIFVNVTTSEAAGALLELNDKNWTMNGTGTNWFKLKSSLADGNYTFRVYANDSAGNRNVSETRWVFVNATRNMTSVIASINQTLAAHNIKTALLDSSGTAANSSSLLSFEKYTLSFNVSSILVQTADFLADSLNASAVLNITRSIALENVSASFNNSGGVMDSYVWVDLNGLLPNGSFTAKIVFPKIYALYFYLNGTKDAPNIIRVPDACNSNTSNIPCYSTSGDVSTLYLPSFSGGAGGNDTQSPSLTISSPTTTTYSSSSVPLSYISSDNAAVDRCWYSLNDGSNTTIAGCSNITINAVEGSNTIAVYVNDTSGNLNQSSVSFTVATPTTTVSQGGGGGGSPTSSSTSTTTITVTTIQKLKEEGNTTNEPIISPTSQTTSIPVTSPIPARTTGLATVSYNLVIGGLVIATAASLAVWRLSKLKAKRKKSRLKSRIRRFKTLPL